MPKSRLTWLLSPLVAVALTMTVEAARAAPPTQSGCHSKIAFMNNI
jgi:hypothetical protein